MTELEPAWIGSDLLRERQDALPDTEFAATYAHWLPGVDVPDTLAGTSIPGNVRIGPFPMPPDVEVPMLDLSWRPPDVASILAEMCAAVGIPDGPWGDGTLTREEFTARLRAALDWPSDPPTERIPIPKEMQ